MLLLTSHATWFQAASYMSDYKIYQEVDPATGGVPKTPTGEELQAWLRARSHNATQMDASGTNPLKGKANLWEAVKAARSQEKLEEERGNDVVLLRSHNGECLHEILLSKGKIAKTIRNAKSDVLDLMPKGASHWHDVLDDLKANLPHTTMADLRQYFKAKDTNEDLPSAPQKAHRRISSQTVLANFRYCEEIDFSTSDLCILGEGERCGCVTMDVPASMRQQDYEAHVIVRTREVQPPLLLRQVVKIETAACGCLGGKDGKCVHVASVLAAMESIERPDDSIVQSSATSKLSWWNQKSRYRHCRFDINVPIACLPFFQQNISIDSEGETIATQRNKNSFLQGTTEGRGVLRPSKNVDAFRQAVRSKTDAASAAVERFMSACREGNENHRLKEKRKRKAHPTHGDKSAFEVTYKCEWDWKYQRGAFPPENPNIHKLQNHLSNDPPPPKGEKKRLRVSARASKHDPGQLAAKQAYDACNGCSSCTVGCRAGLKPDPVPHCTGGDTR